MPMGQVHFNVKATLPSFSIVLETVNLADADPIILSQCLRTLADQELPPSWANEVLLVDSGTVPSDVLRDLCAPYPWITVHRILPGTGYYDAQMQGVSFATGDVVVFCDSDCTYESMWLRSILTPFSQTPDIQVVAGETTTRIVGPYGVAMALTYYFPRLTRREALYKSRGYHFNNVAFRRDLLRRHPIPSGLPLHRGNTEIHALSLRHRGYPIWTQPKARATHPLPKGLSDFLWDFLLMGHDWLAISRVSRGSRISVRPSLERLHDSISCVGLMIWELNIVLRRAPKVLVEDPRRLIHLPLAFPIAFASLCLFFAGLVISWVSPDYVLRRYRTVRACGRHPV